MNISMLHVEDELKQKAQNIIDEFPGKRINPYDFEITAVINLRNKYFQQQSIQSDMFHALDLFSKIAICSYHYDHEYEGLQQLLKEWLDSRLSKSLNIKIFNIMNDYNKETHLRITLNLNGLGISIVVRRDKEEKYRLIQKELMKQIEEFSERYPSKNYAEILILLLFANMVKEMKD